MNSIRYYLIFIFMFLSFSFSFGEIIRIELDDKNLESIDIEIYEEIAPNHADRIKQLVIEGKYNGVVFHRVIDGFMAQTGDVEYGNISSLDIKNVGRGKSNYSDLIAEFSSLKFERGIVGMARSNNPNSANSQFFIMYERADWLDYNYTIWGKVISGMNSLEKLKKGSKNSNGKVLKPNYMKKVFIVQ